MNGFRTPRKTWGSLEKAAGWNKGVLGHVLGDVSLPLTSCSSLLLVVPHGHNEEDEQGDTLNACQEEEIVVQRAVIDVTCRDEK